MEKLTEPKNLYVEGSKEKGEMYKSMLINMGYEVQLYHDFTDEGKVFFNYPGTFKIFDTDKKNVKEVVKDESINIENIVPDFKPFYKVIGLMKGEKWTVDFYSFYSPKSNLYVCVGGNYHKILPYEGNEDRVGKTEDEYLESMPF